MDLETFLQTLTETMHLKVQMVELTLSVFLLFGTLLFSQTKTTIHGLIYIYICENKNNHCASIQTIVTFNISTQSAFTLSLILLSQCTLPRISDFAPFRP